MFTVNLVRCCRSRADLASFLADRQKTKKALLKAWKAFENILPQFLSVLIIIGLALAVLTPEAISRLLGTDSGIFGNLHASLDP
jgi:hypothetical protein